MTESEALSEYVQPKVTVRAFYEDGQVSTVMVEFADRPSAADLSRVIAQFVIKPPSPSAPVMRRDPTQASMCGAVANLIRTDPGRRRIGQQGMPVCDDHECRLPTGHVPTNDIGVHRCHHCGQVFGPIPGVTA